MIMNSDSNTPYSSNKGDNHSMFSFNKYLIHSKESVAIGFRCKFLGQLMHGSTGIPFQTKGTVQVLYLVFVPLVGA